MAENYKALLVTENEDGTFNREIKERQISDLPDGDVLVRVKYSALNYKDALSASGNRGVTKKYPHTPGIDAAGVVAQSTSAEFPEGAEVIVTSYDLGMNTAGGFGEYIRVPAGWVVPLPEGLTLRESMILGTAGLTAGMCLERLEWYGVKPDSGPVLVTGATGGVGSAAVGILAAAGYSAEAVTGKADRKDFLRDLGADAVLSREDLDPDNKRPMLKGRWAGCIDTVGGKFLAAALKAINYGGAVSCCGLVASPELNTTVFPFILRSVALFGIDSAEYPMEKRREIWRRLGQGWKPAKMELAAHGHKLEELPELIDQILQGKISGRAVIEL